MNWARIIQVVNIIVSFTIVIYILIDIAIKARKFNKKKIEKIKNGKYLVLIVILCILFVIYGIMRNFE